MTPRPPARLLSLRSSETTRAKRRVDKTTRVSNPRDARSSNYTTTALYIIILELTTCHILRVAPLGAGKVLVCRTATTRLLAAVAFGRSVPGPPSCCSLRCPCRGVRSQLECGANSRTRSWSWVLVYASQLALLASRRPNSLRHPK
jgi:hypothetical protein